MVHEEQGSGDFRLCRRSVVLRRSADAKPRPIQDDACPILQQFRSKDLAHADLVHGPSSVPSSGRSTVVMIRCRHKLLGTKIRPF